MKFKVLEIERKLTAGPVEVEYMKTTKKGKEKIKHRTECHIYQQVPLLNLKPTTFLHQDHIRVGDIVSVVELGIKFQTIGITELSGANISLRQVKVSDDLGKEVDLVRLGFPDVQVGSEVTVLFNARVFGEGSCSSAHNPF